MAANKSKATKQTNKTKEIIKHTRSSKYYTTHELVDFWSAIANSIHWSARIINFVDL